MARASWQRPDGGRECIAVNLTHHLHLTTFLLVVLLVDADLIAPYVPVLAMSAQVGQGGRQSASDCKLTAGRSDQDANGLMSAVAVPPDILQGLVWWCTARGKFFELVQAIGVLW